MKRRSFLMSLVGLVPAFHIVKEILPKQKFEGKLGQYDGVRICIDPAGGPDADFTSLATWEASNGTMGITSAECKLTAKDIEDMVAEMEKYKVPIPDYYIVSPKEADWIRKSDWRDIPFIESARPKPNHLINIWSS